jgi:uncharacterized protein YyaL (SSP411 family)
MNGEKVVIKKKDSLFILMWISIISIATIVYVGYRKLNRSEGKEEINWISDYSEAFNIAENEDKSIMVYFFTSWCSFCRKQEEVTFANQTIVLSLNKDFVCIQINAEKQENLENKHRIYFYPTTLFFNSNGTEVERLVGYYPPNVFLDKIKLESD